MKTLIPLFASLLMLTSCMNSGISSDPANTGTATVLTQSGVETTASDRVGDKIATDPGYAQCIASAKISCATNFINSYAINNSSTDICREFADENLQTSCMEMVVTETAKKTLDIDRCGAITDTDKRALCKQNVITAKGVKNGDPTVCSHFELASSDIDTLENMKDRCVIHIIDQLPSTEKTKGLCGLIVHEEARTACEERIQLMIDLGGEAESVLPPESVEVPEVVQE